MNVSVVIPNWNGAHLLKKHLKQVIGASRGAQIVVADDVSTDGSVQYLREKFPGVITVTGNRRKGFAANVDTGVARSRGDVVVLLNTDVEPEPQFLAPLADHFADDRVFAVGCLEKSHEHTEIVERGRGIAHWEKGFYVHSLGDVTKHDTAWVSGGSGAFRRSMWDKLGGMDTIYNPFYWEDIDLSYRARKSGWKTLFEPASVVHHWHEQGVIKSEFSPDDVKRIAFRNQFLFIWKNVTSATIIAEHAFWTPIRLLQAHDIRMLEGYVAALARLPEAMRKRTEQRALHRVSDADLNVW